MGASALVENIDNVDIFIRDGSDLSDLSSLTTSVQSLDYNISDGSNDTSKNVSKCI